MVHRKGDDPRESTRQLAEDLMAITTVFVVRYTMENERQKEEGGASTREKKKRKIEHRKTKKVYNLP